MREVPLRLDFRAAPEADVQLLLPLAATLSLHTLLLSAEHASGESLLRSPAISARSGSSLRRLAATVACTDTLRRFPGLQELHLHAGAVEWLYPGGRDAVVMLLAWQNGSCYPAPGRRPADARAAVAKRPAVILLLAMPARSGAARPDQLAAPGPAWLLGG